MRIQRFSAHRSGLSRQRLNVARILVIDDDAGMRRLVRRYLERGAGHEVFEAADGLDGLKVFQQHPFDVVVCDLVMPNMSGLEAIVAMRAIAPSVPLIAISGGMWSREMLPDALRLGVVRALAKPVLQGPLLAAVEHALLVAQELVPAT